MRWRIKHVFLIVVVMMMIIADDSAAEGRHSYFDAPSSQSSNLSMFPKWTRMVARYEEQASLSDEECGTTKYHPCAVKKWKEFLLSLRGKPLAEQLGRINDWGNAHPYILDQMNWGMEDYWETPHEFITVGGDCEDYAIVKYYSLRALGLTDERLRVIIVQDFNLGGIIHAVLGVDGDNSETFILDNQIKQVIPALNIYHYRPIYSINESEWRAYSPKT